MLFRYLDRLRAKPRHVRERHALVMAVLVTGVVALGWMMTLPKTLMQGTAGVGEIDSPRPFATIWNQLRSQVSEVLDTASSSNPGGPTATTTTVSTTFANSSTVPLIILTPDDLAAARASSSIEYDPSPPKVVRIATTTKTSTTTEAN
jgi:hypothetical protein